MDVLLALEAVVKELLHKYTITMENQLIIFAKNPVLGKVKTRLSATIGDEKALDVYKELLDHTCAIASKAKGDKIVYYSDFVNNDDLWKRANFTQALQHGDDLGQRMSNAFKEAFKSFKGKVVIIGTDCKELSTEIIDQAFSGLEYADIVIGPALDGGYYLIGMKSLEEELFKNIEWSTSAVLEQTIDKVDTKRLSFLLLKTLSDIDNEEDLTRSI